MSSLQSDNTNINENHIEQFSLYNMNLYKVKLIGL